MTDQTEIRIQACTALLLSTAREARMAITGDMRVSEANAAALLAYAPGHLKAMRQEGRGPVVYGVGMNGCRVSYRIEDLARWIEATRQGW